MDKRLDSVNFHRIQVINFGDKPAVTRDERRYRISEIHNRAKNYLRKDCEYVMLIEDDTTYLPNTLSKLLKLFDTENVGYATGLQLGRHNVPYIGAWVADDIDNPTVITSLMPGKDTEMIDAGGFYCALTLANLYRNHTFKPYDELGTNGLSCDVNYGLSLRSDGYICLADHSIECDHIGENGSVNLGNTKPRQVTFEKHNHKWTARTI